MADYLHRLLSHRRRLRAVVLLASLSAMAVMAVSAVGLPMVSGVVYAQDSGDAAAADDKPSGPGCAIKGIGEITLCPSSIDKTSTKCYVRDPAAADPNAWQEVGDGPCSADKYPEFAKVKPTVDCTKAEDAKLCDQSMKCQSGNAQDPANTGANGATGTNVQDQRNTCNLTHDIIDPAVKALTALVGVAITISIIWGGIQYSSSGGDPSAVSAAKKRIVTAVLTLIGYFLFLAFLNWVIPGGLT